MKESSQNMLTDVDERLMGSLYKVSLEATHIPESGLDASISSIEQHQINLEVQEFNF